MYAGERRNRRAEEGRALSQAGDLRPIGRIAARIVLVAALAASFLAPSTVAPARTIRVPRTLAGALELPNRPGRAHLGFDATHIAFGWSGDEGTGVRYQLLGAGVDTRWRLAPESGDMETGDRHFSAVLAIDRARLIRYEPVVPPGLEIHAIRLDYMNTVDGPLETRTIPAVARATASTPNVITRAEWGADESLKSTTGSCTRSFYDVQQLFVHHTAGTNNDSNPAATMRAIYQFHVGSRGWCDIGYNFVISWDGRIFEGRWARNYAPWETHSSEDLDGRAVSGAHVGGYNSGSVGVSLMGNFETAQVPVEMRDAAVGLLAWEVDRHTGLQARGKHVFNGRTMPYIAGHRDAGSTSCPGQNLYDVLPDIRKAVEAEVGEGRPTTSLTLTAPERKVDYGTEINATGRLSSQEGTPLAGRTIDLNSKAGAAPWETVAQPLTDLNGSFSYSFTPTRGVKLRAVFPEAVDMWGSQSHDLKIKIRHIVTLKARGGTSDPSGAIIYPPGTERIDFDGNATPAHANREVVVHVYRVKSDGTSVRIVKDPVPMATDGRFDYPFSVPRRTSTTTYTALVWYPADTGHKAGRSDTIRFVVPGTTGGSSSRPAHVEPAPRTSSGAPGSEATIKVTVTDNAGQPVEGHPVEWLGDGVGRVEPIDTMTGPDGTARARVRSDDKGDQRIEARTSECASGGSCSGIAYRHWGSEACTLFGTFGPDVLVGTDANDVICGLDGSDDIQAGKGRDTVFGGRGADVIRGNRGHDTLRGNEGHDELRGGRGRDRCYGGRGRNSFFSCS